MKALRLWGAQAVEPESILTSEPWALGIQKSQGAADQPSAPPSVAHTIPGCATCPHHELESLRACWLGNVGNSILKTITSHLSKVFLRNCKVKLRSLDGICVVETHFALFCKVFDAGGVSEAQKCEMFYLHRVSKIMSIAATTWPLKIENNLCQHCLESGRYCNISIYIYPFNPSTPGEKKSLKKHENKKRVLAEKPQNRAKGRTSRFAGIHMYICCLNLAQVCCNCSIPYPILYRGQTSSSRYVRLTFKARGTFCAL